MTDPAAHWMFEVGCWKLETMLALSVFDFRLWTF